MAGRKRHGVALKQYRKVNNKWQFVSVAEKKGNPDPHYVRIGDALVPSGGGTFYLDYRDASGKRKQVPVGRSPVEALDAWKLRIGIRAGFIEPDPDEEPREANQGKTIEQAAQDYLAEVKATKGKSTLSQYTHDLAWFQSLSKKRYVAELDRSDIMRLFAAGREERVDGKALNQKTINRRVINVLHGMRSQGAVIQMKKGDWPRTIEKKVEAYQPEELATFFAACDPKERVIFQTFLCTGFREQEIANLEWSDIDLKKSAVSVTAKPELGFTPKSYEERTVPIPRKLTEKLKAYRKRCPAAQNLVFATPPHGSRGFEGGKPIGDLLDWCKAVAFRAKLNCSRCKGQHTAYVMKDGVYHKRKVEHQCATSAHCRKWTLHKFRHSFATSQVQDGLDIRTLQVLLGHKNIATTEKYLKSLRMEKLRTHVESSTLAGLL